MPTDAAWYDDRDNLTLLAHWMHDVQGATLKDFAYVLSKPWKFTEEFQLAVRWIEDQNAAESVTRVAREEE